MPKLRLPISIKRGVLVLSLVYAVAPAEAQDRVDVGDVIEIFVARVPELQRRVAVKSDGTISFPLLGSLAIGGLSPSQLEAKIQTTLASKVFQRRTADGREIEVLIDRDEVTATVAEYRPIYVNGDVAKPGEHHYRPFMTARQAVALSGGYDVTRVRVTNNPLFESADLKSEYESLWTEFAKEQAHVWRIKSELGYTDNIDQKALMDVPIAQSMIAQIVGVEAEYMKMRRADHQRQKAFLQRAIKTGDEHVGVLSEQQKHEEQGVKADIEELQRVVDLFGKGSSTSLRVTDARRGLLLSSTRKLQTTAQLMQLTRQQDDLARQLEKVNDQRNIELLRELQDAAVKLSSIRAKLQGVGEKLQYTGVRSQLIDGQRTKPEISIIRKGEKGREQFVADGDTELQPGDVVEVALKYDYVAEASDR
jgi:polysaccharide biosynthesis/export protein